MRMEEQTATAVVILMTPGPENLFTQTRFSHSTLFFKKAFIAVINVMSCRLSMKFVFIVY